MTPAIPFTSSLRRLPVTSSFLSFHHVTFSHEGQAEPLFADCTFAVAEGWTGIIGPNGSGKTTLLLLAVGTLAPAPGRITVPGEALYCAQRTDSPPPDLDDLLADQVPPVPEIRGRLGIDADWNARWDTLSHGERKRAQIGCALRRAPEVLAIDEPTNHVDAGTRRFLLDALRRFRGIGLLVSHDREMLDALCANCLVLDPHRAASQRVVLRPGGYSAAAATARAETERMRAELAEARARARALGAEVRQRRVEAAASRARLSKRGIDRKDHDAKGRIDMARISSRDRTAARQVREFQTRRTRAEEDARRVSLRKDYDVSLWFRSEPARRDTLFTFPAGGIPLGGGRVLEVPALSVAPRDRVALCGPNGSGKSTLVREIVSRLTLPPDRLVIMEQELDEQATARIAAELHSLPGEQLGRALTVVNLLGSDPERILESRVSVPAKRGRSSSPSASRVFPTSSSWTSPRTTSTCRPSSASGRPSGSARAASSS